MHAITFDTLEFTEQLKTAGVPDEQAKGHAKALVTVLKQTDELANKRDLKDLEHQIITKADVADVTKIDTHLLDLKRDIQDLNIKIDTESDDLDAKIDNKIRALEDRMTIRLGLMLVAVAGMFFTALRYFPPTQPIVISSHQLLAPEQNIGKTPVLVQPSMPSTDKTLSIPRSAP